MLREGQTHFSLFDRGRHCCQCPTGCYGMRIARPPMCGVGCGSHPCIPRPPLRSRIETSGKKPNRKMSAAARAQKAVAARARWKKAKAAGKNTLCAATRWTELSSFFQHIQNGGTCLTRHTKGWLPSQGPRTARRFRTSSLDVRRRRARNVKSRARNFP